MLKNPNAKTDWSVGDQCFYQETWSQNIVSGIITNLAGTGEAMTATVNGGKEFPGCVQRPVDTLFATKDDAMMAVTQSSMAKVAAYEQEMPDLNAVLQFAWTHPIATCEEYTDWEARRAYQNRVFALTGIELTD